MFQQAQRALGGDRSFGEQSGLDARQDCTGIKLARPLHDFERSEGERHGRAERTREQSQIALGPGRAFVGGWRQALVEAREPAGAELCEAAIEGVEARVEQSLPIEAAFAGKHGQRIGPAAARLLRNIFVEMRQADLAATLNLELPPNGGLNAWEILAHAIDERIFIFREGVAVGDANRVIGMLWYRNDAIGDETIDAVGNVTNDKA